MKKKMYIAFPVLLFTIGTVAAIAAFSGFGEAQQTTVAQAKVNAKGPLPQCLTDNAQLSPDANEREGIEFAATSQLIDVPAGTNTTVNLATYDGSTATGSELYPKDYGTYNFTAKRDASASASQTAWKMTSFAACKS